MFGCPQCNTIALLCKQTTDDFRTSNPPEPGWRHLSGNQILFVPHCCVMRHIHTLNLVSHCNNEMTHDIPDDAQLKYK